MNPTLPAADGDYLALGDPLPVATSPAAAPMSTDDTSPLAHPRNVEIDARLAELEELAAQLEAMDEEASQHVSLPPLPADFRLSIVVPVYNEQSTIRTVVAKLLHLDLPKEIIVVDDGSEDGTRDELQRLRDIPNLRIILKERNEGKGAALRTGFEYVSGTIVMVQDADLEYEPRDIPGLLRPILGGEADVVYGSRFLEQRWTGSSPVHRLGNRLLTIASNLTTGLRLTDMETCYKVFSASVLQDLHVRQDRFGFEPEVTAKLARRGLRFREVPVRYDARSWDQGKKIGMRDALNAFFCILRYAWVD